MTNTQTIAELWSYGHTFGALCSQGHPARRIDVDMDVLIAKLGPNVTVPEAMKKIVCSECGKHVAVTISHKSIRHVTGAYPKPVWGLG